MRRPYAWGYDGYSPGATIHASTNRPIKLRFINQLPAQHLFKAGGVTKYGSFPCSTSSRLSLKPLDLPNIISQRR